MSLFSMFLIFFSQVSDSLTLLLYSLHVRLLRALIKINQSINAECRERRDDRIWKAWSVASEDTWRWE